jgi:predicted thioredoxin/glutaredoxin
MQNFIKKSYVDSMAKEDREDDGGRSAAVKERELELASEYEKVMMRLNNMYCRQIFWNMIQKDNMEELFKALFLKESDIKAFACFLKVIGNESYITKNTRQIKSFSKFLQDVI